MRATGSITLDRTNGTFIKAEKYVNDLNWTKGIDPKLGKPVEYSPKLDVQIYNPEARALRGDPTKRTCPTWHGGIAHQPLAFNPIKNIAYGVGTEGCSSANGAAVASRGPDGGVNNGASEQRKFSSDLYYGSVTAFDAINHKVVAKAVVDIEVRSGITATAGGVVFNALEDGWVVARTLLRRRTCDTLPPSPRPRPSRFRRRPHSRVPRPRPTVKVSLSGITPTFVTFTVICPRHTL